MRTEHRAPSRRAQAEMLECRVLLSADPLEPLDPSFNQTGVAITDFGPRTYNWASDLLVEPDGKVLVSGGSEGPGAGFPIRRLNEDGTPDATFGVDGLAKPNPDPARRLYAVMAIARDSLGRIIAVGSGRDGSFATDGWVVARYNDDGSPDDTFGQGGVVLTQVPFSVPGYGNYPQPNAVLLQPDSKIVVGGNSGGMRAMVRYNDDGTLDQTFSDDGMSDAGGEGTINELLLQPDGKLIGAGDRVVVVDSPLGEMAVIILSAVRLNGDGAVDGGFGAGGRVDKYTYENGYLNNGQARAAALRPGPDGKILVGGFEQPRQGGTILPASFALYSLNPDGSPDESFGDGGRIQTDFGEGGDLNSGFEDMLLRPDGTAVVVGTAADGDHVQPALAAYDTAGNPAPNFGTNGKIIWTSMHFGEQIAQDAQGRILLAGAPNESTIQVAVARYIPFPVLSVGTSTAAVSASNGSAAVAAAAAAPTFVLRRTGDLSRLASVRCDVAGLDLGGAVLGQSPEVFTFGAGQNTLAVPTEIYGRLLLGDAAGSLRLTVTDAAGHRLLSAASASVPFTGGAASGVVVAGRRIFYNGSAFDANGPAVDARDAAAIAPDKSALLPGQRATFAHYTSYPKGVNGIIIDFAGMPPGIAGGLGFGPSDFTFRSGNDGNAGAWPAVATQAAVTVIPSPYASNTARVAITWPAGAVRQAWLQVTVKANERTGLAAPDVFYFGNLIGETGDRATPMRVSAADLLALRRNLAPGAVPITSDYDINRDGKVNALDLAALRTNLSHTLRPITPPAVAATNPAPAANLFTESTTRRVWDVPPRPVLG